MGKFWARSTYFEIDMAIGKAVGTALVEEVNVLDEQAEERDHNLRKRNKQLTTRLRTNQYEPWQNLKHRR